jgi:hypothetical protein
LPFQVPFEVLDADDLIFFFLSKYFIETKYEGMSALQAWRDRMNERPSAKV